MSLPIMTSFPSERPMFLAGGVQKGAILKDGIASGAVANVWTLTIDDDTGSGAFEVDDTVVVTVYDDAYPDNVITVTYTIVTGVTDEDGVAAGFRAQWQDELQANAWLSAGSVDTSGADATIAFTGRVPGQDFTLTVTDQGGGAATLVETTSAADAGDIEPGRVVMGYYVSGVLQYSGTTTQIRKMRSASFTAMSKTWTVSGLDTAGARLVTRYKFLGVERVVSTVMNASNNQTVTDHVAALETSFNASPFTAGAGLVASDGTGAFTIQPDTAGNVFEAVSFLDGPDTNATVVVAETGGVHDPTYSAVAAFLGISAWTSSTAPTTYVGASGVHPGGSCLPFVAEGPVAVVNSQSPTVDDVPYIDAATNLGRVYNAAVAGYIALCYPDGRRPVKFAGLNNNGCALLRVGAV